MTKTGEALCSDWTNRAPKARHDWHWMSAIWESIHQPRYDSMKRYSMPILLVATLVVAAFPLVGAAQSTDVLFQEAQRLERVQGDYQGAIGIYQRIVGAASAERAAVARALVQMGKAYESLGRTEAFSVYERVVRDFADLKEQVSEARRRMRGLTVNEPLPPTEPVISFVSEGFGRPSPDGRFLALIDADFNLVVYDTGNRSARVLAASREGEETNEYADFGLSWSPEGRSIAYTWWIYHRDPSAARGWSGGAKELRIVDTSSGSVRVLAAGEGFIPPNDWSRDGRFIYGKGPNPPDVSRIDVKSGASQIAWTDSSGEGFGAVRFSPDGRYLGFTRYPKDRSDPDIWVAAADGSSEWAVVDHPADDYGMYWSPDGSTLIFSSDRTGVNALWAVRVQDGRAAGEAYLLHPDLGPWTQLHGFSRDGRLFFSRHLANVSIFTAEIDVDAVRVLSGPVRVAVETEGVNEAPSWSPDGTKLAWGRRWSPGDDEETHLVVRDMATGRDSDIVPQRDEGASSPWTLHTGWSPDGSRLFANIRTYPTADFKRVDYETGEVESTSIQGGERVPSFLDEDRLVYLRSDSVFIRNLATATDRLLITGADGQIDRIKPSQDGSRLALLKRTSESTSDHPTEVWTVDISTGHAHRIAVASRGEYFDARSEINWLLGDDAILVALIDADEKVAIGRVDLDSGAIRVFDGLEWPVKGGVGDYNMGPAIYGLHPDGKTIVFTIGYNRFEMWAIDNLLSK